MRKNELPADSGAKYNIQSENEVEIDLKELFLQLLAHWKLLLLCTFLCGAAAYAYCRFFVTPLYSATSGLYVFSKSTSVTSLTDLQVGSNLTADYEIVITGRPVLERVITRLDLNESYNSLRSRINVSNPNSSRILYITCTDPDPNRAKEIADRTASIASTFISQKMDQDPPSIIQTGYADGSPVSPRTMRNAAIAALIGLLLAGAWVTVTWLLNDSILTPEDAQKKLGLNILASLPLEEEGKASGRKRKRRHHSGHKPRKSA